MTTAGILDYLPKLSVLVVGDICLDRWCWYDPVEAEASRETGIPRIAVIRTEVTPGAGGTIANNLAAIGVGRVTVIGAVGGDGYAYELRQALAVRNIGEHLVTVPGMQTFTYTKLINAASDVEDRPRVDFISTTPLDRAAERQILDRLQTTFDSYDAILISDQAETSRGGVVTEAVRDLVADLAPSYPERVIVADSRVRAANFRNVILKPNQQEGEAASREIFGRVDFAALRRHTRSPLLLVTHGGDGALLIHEGGEQWVRARKVENPVDICGAGDSFAAGLAAALAAKASAVEAVQFGNRVANITIMKRGTGTASPKELLATNEHE